MAATQENHKSLGDVANKYGFDWLIGRWMTKTDEGEKMVAFYSKVNDETMKAELYAVKESGELADEPLSIQEYKRKAIKAEKKTVDKTGKDFKKKRKEKKD